MGMVDKTNNSNLVEFPDRGRCIRHIHTAAGLANTLSSLMELFEMQEQDALQELYQTTTHSHGIHNIIIQSNFLLHISPACLLR